jgi:pimeloyl-ACP methyl ester carboxylesterase
VDRVDRVRAGALDVAYERHGARDGWPVVLLHGFPYDPRCYDEVVTPLARAGADVVVPYLRGYGATRFVDASTLRSGQQAALAHDLLDLIGALVLERPIVGGYDWGGRAACLVSALWPARVSGLVTVDGYNVQDIAAANTPAAPELESGYWYQFYLHGERGRNGLAANRADFARLLWRQWSPRWPFTGDEFAATVPSFDNPDFVEVVVHSYRHRYGLVDGDPAYAATERLIAAQPVITVPTVVLDSEHDGLGPPDDRTEHEAHFADLVEHRLVDAGHNLPQENPTAFAEAVLLLRERRSAAIAAEDHSRSGPDT